MNSDYTIIDTKVGGSVSLNATGLSGNQTLATNQYQPLTLNVTGTPTAAITYVVPSGVGGFWIFKNNTSGGQTVGIASAAGGAVVAIPAGDNAIVTCDGTATGMLLASNVPTSAAGATTQLQYNSGGLLAGSAGLTFDGTTLATTGLNVSGNVVLGSGAGSTLTLNGGTAAIPNGLTIGTGNLLVLQQSSNQVAIGTTPSGGNLLTLAGNAKFTTGGIVFSDGTQLLSATGLGPSLLRGYISGLQGSAPGGVNTFNIGTGSAIDSTITVEMTLPSAMIKTSGSWAAGSGQGSLDVGSIQANQTYHTFLIERLDTGVSDILTSLSATSPALPTHYTLFRRIFSMRTDASKNWILFSQVGDYFYTVGGTNFNSSLSFGPALGNFSVPTGIMVQPLLNIVTNLANNGQITVSFAPAALPSLLVQASNSFNTGPNGAQWGTNFVAPLTNTSAQLQVYTTVSTGGQLWSVVTYGWIDRRGQDGNP